MAGGSVVDRRPAVRLGAVSYLNARPLACGLARLAPDIEVMVDLPSRLADGLAAGELDAALIPSIEHFRQPGSRVVSNACVACEGPVRSVKLYSRVPVEQIETLALDEGSRTSAALVQILLRGRFGRRPRVVSLPIGSVDNAFSADAVMLIGDRGMHSVPGEFEFVWDLGQEWHQWTGLPFVFAMWVARPDAPLARLHEVLNAARDWGEEHLEDIATAAAAEVGLSATECLTYLHDNLDFELGPRQCQGLRLFHDLARRHELVPAGGKLVFFVPSAR
jgi:chorismate dehydratase